MSSSAALGPDNALQLVQLKQLVENVAESAYKGLQDLTKAVPALSDEERRHALLLHLHATRQRLLRLHVLVEWSNKAMATKEVGKVLSKASNHAEAIRESADQLFYLNQELQATTGPLHDVFTAREVLETGQYDALPSVISALGGAPKPSDEEQKASLRFMDFLVRSLLLKEKLPKCMHLKEVSSGHANFKFQGYYTAVLTLAEAPEVQLDPDQAQDPAQAQRAQRAQLAQPVQQAQHAQQAQQAQQPQQGQQSHQQPPNQAGATQDIQGQEVFRQVLPDANVGPHKEKYRWRLLSFAILPDAPHAVLQLQQQVELQAQLEHNMWVAADIRAQKSLFAAQQARRAQHSTDTAQSAPQASDTTQDPYVAQQAKHTQQGINSLPSASNQPLAPQSQHLRAADTASSQHASQGQSQIASKGSAALPWGAPHPLQLLHDTLGTIAGRIVLQQVYGSLQRLTAAKGKWPSLLKLNAAAVLSNGIRCSYWLDIQTASPPADNYKPQDATQDNIQNATIGRPPLRPPQQTQGGPPSHAPALEFGLTPSGAVTVISVPQLPAESAPWPSQDSATQVSATEDPDVSALSESAAQDSGAPAFITLRLELDLKTCDTQQLLLMAAASNAGVQLGALQHAIGQQPSLSNHGCRCTLHTEAVHQGIHLSHRPQSPCLSMHSRDAELLVVSVQLKIGYMKVGLGKAVAPDKEVVQLLKQAEAKLVSTQKDMRHAPLEDPTLPRGVALSQALAKELAQLFQAVNQKACFAQMTTAAQQHGLQQAQVPSKLLQAFVNTHPNSPMLQAPSCLALAFPPSPLLQPCPPQHLPTARIGLPVGVQPTVSLTLPQSIDSQAGDSHELERYSARGRLQERDLKLVQKAQQAQQVGGAHQALAGLNLQQAQHAQQAQQAQHAPPQRKPMHTVFSSAKKPGNNKLGAASGQQAIPHHVSQGKASQTVTTGAVAANGPVALRFFLSTQLQQSAHGPTWTCYLLKCTCTASMVLKQVLSCTPVPGQLLQDPASVKPPGCAATHRPSSDNQATDVTQTAAATSLPSMPEALDSQQTSLRKAAASNGDRAQVGSKRKRADSDNDAAMLNAGAEDTASAKQAQHSQQQQHVKQEPSLENGQTAVSNSDEVKPEPTHPPQFMQQHAEQQPQSNTPQTDVEEPTPEAQEGVQQPEVNPIVPHTVSQMSNWGHGEGQPLGGQTSWGDKLGRVVQWCWGYIVKEHVLTELQVLGLPCAEELQFHADVSNSIESCPHDRAVPNKRQKLSHPESSPAIKAESRDPDPRYHADSTDSKQRHQSMRSMVIVEGLNSLRGLDKLVSAARRAEMPQPGSTVTVDLPSNDSTALPYQWTAVIHSAYLAQLSAAALHQPSVLLPFSPLHPGCVGHVPSLTSSTARPAAAVQPNSKHIQPQVFTKHPFGLSVQCNLMQQGTVTALTELIAGTARMHTCLNRIQQLMKQQQQQLSRHDSAAGHDSVAGQRQLAWHVVSSAVVQLKQIGLTFATLEVRPPPPWNSKVLQEADVPHPPAPHPPAPPTAPQRQPKHEPLQQSLQIHQSVGEGPLALPKQAAQQLHVSDSAQEPNPATAQLQTAQLSNQAPEQPHAPDWAPESKTAPARAQMAHLPVQATQQLHVSNSAQGSYSAAAQVQSTPNANSPHQQTGTPAVTQPAADADMPDAAAVSPSIEQRPTARHNATTDTVMTDVTAASPPVEHKPVHQEANQMHHQPISHQSADALRVGSSGNSAARDRVKKRSEEEHKNPPEPYLTLQVQWRLCHAAQTQLSHAQLPQTQLSHAPAPQTELSQAQGSVTQQSHAVMPPQQRSAAGAVRQLSRTVTGADDKPVGALAESTGAAAGPAGTLADFDGNSARPQMRCCVHAEPALPAGVLECFREMLESGEEGLFLDALGIVAQPLAAVAAAVSKKSLNAAGLPPDQLKIVCKRPPYQLQLRIAQVNRPPALISLKFIQGGFTFVALAATPTVHQTQSASLSAANISQQADLPKRMQAVFSEVHVYLPQGVSQSTAASPQYFGLAQQHRTSAAFWTRSSNLTRVLQLLVQP